MFYDAPTDDGSPIRYNFIYIVNLLTLRFTKTTFKDHNGRNVSDNNHNQTKFAIIRNLVSHVHSIDEMLPFINVLLKY